DRPALKPLPPTRYAVSEWKRVKVNIDYHVDVHGHFYSAPYSLARFGDRDQQVRSIVISRSEATLGSS
ncbi:hypothetical protein U8525_34630, partial [Corallococcus sp. RDP092CA]